jgi:hypothetical protein
MSFLQQMEREHAQIPKLRACCGVTSAALSHGDHLTLTESENATEIIV